MIYRSLIAACLTVSSGIPGAALAQAATITQPATAKAPAGSTIGRARNKPVKMFVQAALPPLPDAWVTLEQRAGWTVTRVVPAGLPGTPPSLFVQRRGPLPFGESCPTFTDRIDLAPLRAHGFRLVGTGYAPYPLAAATSDTPQVVRLDATGQRLVGDIAQTVSWLITTHTVFEPTRSGRPARFCALSYRLSVEVIGPREVDPLTGKRMPTAIGN